MIITRNDNRGNDLDRLVIDLLWFFLSHFFVILLILACCVVRTTLAETCEETTVWIAILSSTVGYILPSPKLLTK